MSLYHDTDAHDSDDLMFRLREAERESRRKIRELDCWFCLWCAVIVVAAVTIAIVR